jgi:hypothetical protein
MSDLYLEAKQPLRLLMPAKGDSTSSSWADISECQQNESEFYNSTSVIHAAFEKYYFPSREVRNLDFYLVVVRNSIPNGEP